MNDWQLLCFFLGAYGLVVAIGLAFVKTDQRSINKLNYLMPGITLYRYPAFRWSMVVFGTGFSLFCFAMAFGLVEP